MKTNLLIILTLLVPLSAFGQQLWISPAANGIIEWNYSCHDSYSHDICFGDAAFDMGNLISGSNYLIDLDIPSEYNNFDVYLEPSDHDNWDGDDGFIWEWLREDINYESLGLVFCGRNEDIVAGSIATIGLNVEPQYGQPRSAHINVHIVTPYYISGPDLACSSPVSFTLEEVPTTYTTFTWQIKQGSSVISSGTGNTAAANISSNGNYQVGFVMNFTCGLESFPITKSFHFGPYSSSDYPISGPSSALCQSYVYYSIPQLEGVTSINWTWPQNWSYVSGQGTRYLALRTGNYSGIVAVGVNNDCGQSGSYDTQYTSVFGFCGYSIKITPNPATDFINISIEEPEISISDSIPNLLSYNNEKDATEFIIMVSDRSGKVYNEFIASEKTFNFSVQHLMQGNYIITASKGKIKISSQFVVKH